MKSQAKTAEMRRQSAASSQQKDSGASYLPLSMERRRARHLPHEAQMRVTELESLAQSLIQQQEERQQSISRELHDNVAQVLAAVTNRLCLARNTTKVPAWLRQEMSDLQACLDAALTDIRTLARDLRPALLDHCGFAATLQRHAEDFRERTAMDFDLQVEPAAADFLDSAGLTHLFRLVQEAIQNVEEHSQATRAWIRLGRRGDSMQLEVGDNGKSFDSQRIVEAQADGHLGLLGMRERSELLGGSFLLEAAPGSGTTVRVTVPLPGTAKPSTPEP